MFRRHDILFHELSLVELLGLLKLRLLFFNWSSNGLWSSRHKLDTATMLLQKCMQNNRITKRNEDVEIPIFEDNSMCNKFPLVSKIQIYSGLRCVHWSITNRNSWSYTFYASSMAISLYTWNMYSLESIALVWVDHFDNNDDFV